MASCNLFKWESWIVWEMVQDLKSPQSASFLNSLIPSPKLQTNSLPGVWRAQAYCRCWLPHFLSCSELANSQGGRRGGGWGWDVWGGDGKEGWKDKGFRCRLVGAFCSDLSFMTRSCLISPFQVLEILLDFNKFAFNQFAFNCVRHATGASQGLIG